MADSSDAPGRQLEKQFELIEAQRGDKVPDDEAERLIEYGHALYEGDQYPVYKPDGQRKSYSAASVRNYLLRLRVDVYGNGHTLTGITPDDFNQLMNDLDSDRARSTTTQTQSAAKHFFRYYPELDVDPEAIEVFETDQSQRRVDPRTLLRPEEVEALRREVDNTRMPRRNRALLELMIYTGQRVRALQTLRAGDVEVNERPGAIYLNDDVEGLKDATKRGRYRPLTAARSHVREWINHHPARDDDGDLPEDAWLFVGQPDHAQTDLSRPWHTDSMRGMLKRAAVRAGIQSEDEDNRVTPHAFRHYWYTHMRMVEDADPEKLKAAGGWSKTSNTPEQIYQDFEDEELMQGLEEELGFREAADDDGPGFMPDMCPSCGEPGLKPHWKECPACGEYLHDPTLRDIEEDATAAKYEGEESEFSAAIQRAIMERPDIAEAIIEQMDTGG